MTEDERAIRDMVRTWMDASMANDIDRLLSLMTDDVVFQVVGQKPFGKPEFAAASRAAPKGTRIDAHYDIQEIKVLGDWAYMRNHISVAMTPAGAKTIRRAGYTLTILEKIGGCWLLTRDANVMTTLAD